MAPSIPTQVQFPVNGSGHQKLVNPPEKPLKRAKKYRSVAEIMEITKNTMIIENNDYSKKVCEECGSGDKPGELLLCDKCDKGFHMGCSRPVVVRIPIGSWFCSICSDNTRITSIFTSSFSQKNIIDFFKIQKDVNIECSIPTSSTQDFRKRRRRSSVLYGKKQRRFLPYVPSEDLSRRLEQLRTLATALTASNIEFSNELTYLAPRSANRANYEKGGMQVLSKEDHETVEHCRAMAGRGEFPPLKIVFDECEGHTIEADGPIKQMTFITEYTGDVDYIINREKDDCDSLMTLILSTDPSKSLLISADKRANISRFISGINDHTSGSKKKQNVKWVRYDVKGECCVLLVATRDISEGERLFCDYNGYEYMYPTHHFV